MCESTEGIGSPCLWLGVFPAGAVCPLGPAVGFEDESQFFGQLGDLFQVVESLRVGCGLDSGGVDIDPSRLFEKHLGVVFASESGEDESEAIVGLLMRGFSGNGFPEAPGGDLWFVSGDGEAAHGGPDAGVFAGGIGQLVEPGQEAVVVSGFQQDAGKAGLCFGHVGLGGHGLLQQLLGAFEVLVGSSDHGQGDQWCRIVGVALVKASNDLGFHSALVSDGQHLQVQQGEAVLSTESDSGGDGFPASGGDREQVGESIVGEGVLRVELDGTLILLECGGHLMLPVHQQVAGLDTSIDRTGTVIVGVVFEQPESSGGVSQPGGGAGGQQEGWPQVGIASEHRACQAVGLVEFHVVECELAAVQFDVRACHPGGESGSGCEQQRQRPSGQSGQASATAGHGRA